jgi:hypothetical protein
LVDAGKNMDSLIVSIRGVLVCIPLDIRARLIRHILTSTFPKMMYRWESVQTKVHGRSRDSGRSYGPKQGEAHVILVWFVALLLPQSRDDICAIADASSSIVNSRQFSSIVQLLVPLSVWICWWIETS